MGSHLLAGTPDKFLSRFVIVICALLTALPALPAAAAGSPQQKSPRAKYSLGGRSGSQARQKQPSNAARQVKSGSDPVDAGATGQADGRADRIPQAREPLTSEDASALGRLEKRLFFQVFQDEALDSRLARIEKQMFGEVLNEPFVQRLARVRQFAPQDEAPAGGNDRNTSTAPAATNSAPAAAAPSGGGRGPILEDEEIDRARQAILAARDEEIVALLSEGVALWRQKRAQEAAQCFEQVLRLDPTNAEANFSLGILEESTGNLVEALTSYQQAVRSRPDNREYSQAVEALERKLAAKQVAAGRQDAIRMLAENAGAAYKRGDFVRAIDLYKELDAHVPNQALVKYNLGTLHLMVKDQPTALRYYEQANRLSPSEPRYAKAYQQLKEEMRALEEAVRRNNQQAATVLKQDGVKPAGGKAAQSSKAAGKAATGGAGKANSAPPQAAATNKGRASWGVSGTGLQSSPVAQGLPFGGGYLNTHVSDAMSNLGLIGTGTREGVRITTVGPASRAAAAGLRPGDHIRAVDGNEVYDVQQVNEILMQRPPNAPVQMMIMRDGNLGVITM